MNKPVLMIGAGGHAAVLIDILRQLNYEILGLVSFDEPKERVVFSGLKWFSNDEDVLSFDNDKVLLVNGVGSTPGNHLRFELHRKFKKLGYEFLTVVSPHAVVSKYTVVSEGTQIMPGCIINANTTIGKNTIINTGSIIEHDCVIGDHNHIAPGVTFSGGIHTKDFVHVGTGASIGQGVLIGNWAVIGAGSSIVKNIDDKKVIYPAAHRAKEY